MNFFDPLLGFAVLTGPLWLILILFPISIWVAVKLAKRFKQRSTKIAGGVGIFLLVFLVPFGDEIAGRIYLSHLCATEAGVKVYQTVELPAEYWDEQGRAKPKIFKSSTPGIIRLVGINAPIFEESPFTELYSPFFQIERAGFRLREIESKKIPGEVVYFRYWHGWIARNFSPNRSAISCDSKNLDGWESAIFDRPLR